MRDNKGKISQVLQAISVLPLLAFALITFFLSYQWFTNTMYEEVAQELQYVAYNVNTLLETAYPGDYRLVEADSLRLYKGDSDITDASDLLDRMKADFDLEITVFYQDTRILTTIHRADGGRISGTAAPETVISDVLMTGESKFYNKVLVGGSNYFAYYMPVRNSDNTVVGMIFVGKPTYAVNAAVQKALRPLLATTLVTMVIISLMIFLYAKRLARALQRIRSFLVAVSTGNLTAELDSSVTNRKDEFGDIARSALSMQRSLRTMLEQDNLTQLYNRRTAERKLEQTISRYETDQTPFCVAIGDIDFFKKVNDTYGHSCGDLVLKNISATLKEHMRNHGFAARWGGEEFLLVFDRTDLAQAHKVLVKLQDDIHALESPYNDQVVKVTMTFGLTAGETANITQLLKLADEKLYIGKNSGRDCIICQESDTAPDSAGSNPV